MEFKTFHIKQELLPTRCDVCHQADLFDPKTGMCERCHSVLPAETDLRSGVLVYQRPLGLNWRITEILNNTPPLPVGLLFTALREALALFPWFFVPLGLFLEMGFRALTIGWLMFNDPGISGALYWPVAVALIALCVVINLWQLATLTVTTGFYKAGEALQWHRITGQISEHLASLLSTVPVIGAYRLLIAIWGIFFLIPTFTGEFSPWSFASLLFPIALIPPLYAFGSSSFVMEFLLLDRFNQDPLLSSQTYFGRNWRLLSVYWLLRWGTVFGTACAVAVLFHQLGYAFIWFCMVMFPLHSLLTAFFTITKTLLFTEIETDVRRRLNEALPVAPNPSE
ncbi:MAG: hypothetical protein HY774_00825 [Acidobacteria bacterium]|nr:hypothetical protein [Acidobacteriota bacterium]